MKKLKLIKTKRGYIDGNNSEYTYGDRVFLVGRGYHKYFFYEKPRINNGQHIFEYNYHERFTSVVKKFRLLLESGQI